MDTVLTEPEIATLSTWDIPEAALATAQIALHRIGPEVNLGLNPKQLMLLARVALAEFPAATPRPELTPKELATLRLTAGKLLSLNPGQIRPPLEPPEAALVFECRSLGYDVPE